MTSVAVLISGRGSNLGALIEAVARGDLKVTIRVVVSNRPDAAGLIRASAAGIETVVLDHRAFARREDYDRALVDELTRRGIELVCLAGFMRLLGPSFCDAFADRILNIHPSLLPAFPGEHAQRQALAHGVRVSGATVHLVTAELDGGPIVAQSAVPVMDDDTEALLSRRILEVEHRLFPDAVARIARGGWHIEGRRVVFPAE